MFSKLALFAVAYFAVFVAALPSPDGGINNSCNGGQVYCCNSFQSATSKGAQEKIAGLGAVAPIAGTVGLTCTPVSVLALSKQACTAQSSCCSGNNFGGTVVAGCSPVHVGGP